MMRCAQVGGNTSDRRRRRQFRAASSARYRESSRCRGPGTRRWACVPRPDARRWCDIRSLSQHLDNNAGMVAGVACSSRCSLLLRAVALARRCRRLPHDVGDVQPQAATHADARQPPQIVAWVEKPDGTYVDTIYITAKTGRFGLGNRPGRYDFNTRLRSLAVRPPRSRRSRCGRTATARRSDGRRVPELARRSARLPRSAAARTTTCSAARTTSATRSTRARPSRTTAGRSSRHETQWRTVDTGTCATAAFTDKGKFTQRPAGETDAVPAAHRRRRAQPDATRRSVDMYTHDQPVRRGLAGDAASVAQPSAAVVGRSRRICRTATT